MHSYYDYIGKNIQAARHSVGYTQEQLARELDISTSVISRLETGRSYCGRLVWPAIRYCFAKIPWRGTGWQHGAGHCEGLAVILQQSLM